MLRVDWHRLKGYAPLCFITLGIVLWRVTAPFAVILPWIISAMLFFAVLNMPLRAVAPRPKHLVLLAMTSLMEGDTGFATGYTILTHGLICFLAPFLLPLLDDHSQLPFWTLSGQIALLVARMVILPITLAWLVRYLMKRRGRTPGPHRTLTYWLWLSSLIFILGKAVAFVSEEGGGNPLLLVASFGVGFLACALQFTLGPPLSRWIGVEEVACRQAMGQKNTALTLWLCISFMHPLVAPGIAGYIAWQNFFLTYYMNRYLRQSTRS